MTFYRLAAAHVRRDAPPSCTEVLTLLLQTKARFARIPSVLLVVAGVYLAFWSINARADQVSVSIHGLSNPLRDNVELLLDIHNLGKSPSESTIKRAHQRAEDQIRQALQPFGFYSPHIEATLSADQVDSTRWQASYVIQPGEEVRYRKVDIKIDAPGGSPTAAQPATNQISLRAK